MNREKMPINVDTMELINNLACAVIYQAAKEYGKNETLAANFFLGPDYRFWAVLAGIEVDGETMMREVLARGGPASLASFSGINLRQPI